MDDWPNLMPEAVRLQHAGKKTRIVLIARKSYFG